MLCVLENSMHMLKNTVDLLITKKIFKSNEWDYHFLSRQLVYKIIWACVVEECIILTKSLNHTFQPVYILTQRIFFIKTKYKI